MDDVERRGRVQRRAADALRSDPGLSLESLSRLLGRPSRQVADAVRALDADGRLPSSVRVSALLSGNGNGNGAGTLPGEPVASGNVRVDAARPLAFLRNVHHAPLSCRRCARAVETGWWYFGVRLCHGDSAQPAHCVACVGAMGVELFTQDTGGPQAR